MEPENTDRARILDGKATSSLLLIHAREIFETIKDIIQSDDIALSMGDEGCDEDAIRVSVRPELEDKIPTTIDIKVDRHSTTRTYKVKLEANGDYRPARACERDDNPDLRSESF